MREHHEIPERWLVFGVVLGTIVYVVGLAIVVRIALQRTP